MAPYGVYLIRDFHGVLIGRGELVGARQGVGGVGEGGRRDDGGAANSLRAGVDPLTPLGVTFLVVCGLEGRGLWVQ